MKPAAAAPVVLWRFSDGRRGHDAQSRGLAVAIARLRSADTHDIPAGGAFRSALELLSGRFATGEGLPDPDLLIGAGHGTHLPLLAARRARGGRAILLMRPSLPVACFDLCLIPDHDGVAEGGNIVLTRGPLNTIVSVPPSGGDRGLILIGGASRHFRWTEPMLLEQLREILAASGDWILSDSPRTPPSTRRLLRELPGVHYVPWDSGADGWLAGELARAARVWVTADSVSMIHEALTAGAAVGILELPPARDGDRVAEAIRRLRSERWVTAFGDWRPGTALPRPPKPLAEAARCAEIALRLLA